MTASSPSRNTISIVIAFLRALEDARQLDEKRRARSAVAGADEAELAKQLGVVVARDREAILARAGNGHDQVDHVHPPERRLSRPTPARRL